LFFLDDSGDGDELQVKEGEELKKEGSGRGDGLCDRGEEELMERCDGRGFLSLDSAFRFGW
jgi:hypothetical protein